jgi:hypothetical protein
MTIAITVGALLWLACSAYVMLTMWHAEKLAGALLALLGPVTIIGALLLTTRCERKGPSGAVHIPDID